MNFAGVNSAAHAVKAWLAVAGAHAMSEAVPALNLYQLAAVFGLSFIIGVFNYLDANPLALSLSNPNPKIIAN